MDTEGSMSPKPITENTLYYGEDDDEYQKAFTRLLRDLKAGA